MSTALRIVLILIATPALAGCGLGYYWQAATGHLNLMNQREPVEDLLNDPATDPALGDWLQSTREALAFAHDRLGLPDNGSYRHYADIGRDYVVWNVFAAPPLDLIARSWCYPVAGCVSYRGYFKEEAARKFAAEQGASGDDVFVGGASAYSTLGRFKDPLLSTMTDLADYRLAGLLFHELAHQRFYLADDTTFNESFASAVEIAGVRLWLAERGDFDQRCRFEDWLVRKQQVTALLEQAREQLTAAFAAANPDPDKQQHKQRIYAELRGNYAALRAGWVSAPFFDGWFGPQLNNASLSALATYDAYVPGFLGLLTEENGDFEAFFVRVEALAEQPEEARRSVLKTAGELDVSQPCPADPVVQGPEPD